MNRWVAYVFEAKGIQAYITAGGRLRDLAGGSAMVEALCAEAGEGDGTAADGDAGRRGLPPSGLLDRTLAACGVAGHTFSKRAAGAFTLVVEARDGATADALTDFAKLWPLVAARAAPDLETVSALAVGGDAKLAVSGAVEALQAARSQRVLRLPLAPPLAARAPRTGAPAVDLDGDDAEAGAARGAVDAATRRKRRFPSDAPALARRVLPPGHPGRSAEGRRIWPTVIVEREAETARRGGGPAPLAFPFPDEEDRTVAVMHADANRMGLAFRRLGNSETLRSENYVETLHGLSETVREVAEEAIQAAVSAHLCGEPVMPARPILAGGDDISFILRGDRALPFVQTLLEAFEAGAHRIVEYLEEKGVADLPPRATLTAGLVFVGPSQPFSAAHRLAEEVCKFAKMHAKAGRPLDAPVPSTIAFHRATASALASWKDILDTDLTVAGKRRLTLSPYTVGATDPGLPPLAALRRLCDALQVPAFSRGPARELVSLLSLSPETAHRRYRRWREVLRDKEAAGLSAFDEAMRGLGVDPAAGIFAAGRAATPLADAVSLIAAERGAVAAVAA